jgi:hypothetical protein
VNTIAQSSTRLGVKFANRLTASGLKQADLEQSLQQYAQQEQQAYDQAQQIRAPGPLRSMHQHLVDALELRAKGLASLGDALSQTASAKDASAAAVTLTKKAQLLTASDVVWDELYKAPASQQLATLGITGVVIPESHFISNTDLVSARSFSLLFGRLHPASTGGTPSGKHGDGLVSVKVLPQGATLSTSTATKVTVSADLSVVATVENSGDFQEVTVPVTMTIMVGGKPMIDSNGKPLVRRRTIPSIQAAERQTVTFTNFSLPTSAFATQPSIKVEVGPVPGEIYLANNSATYPVFFSLSGP